MRQGFFEASTCGVSDAYLLAHQSDGRLVSVDYLWMAARVRLVVIPSVDKALHDLGMFDFVTLYLFSAGGLHSSTVTNILRLIEILEELHTKVQGMISPPHLFTALL